MLKLVETNERIKLSCSSLNKLLTNRRLYRSESELANLIRRLREPNFLMKGLLKKLALKFGQYDYTEVTDEESQLTDIDSAGEFPLLKYIKHSKSCREETLRQLWSKKFTISTESHSVLVKLNEIMKRATFLPRNRSIFRRDI